jgi:hypothetical protein
MPSFGLGVEKDGQMDSGPTAEKHRNRSGKLRQMKKVDSNHSEIVKGLRTIGASVRSTAGIGKGFPDIAVGYRNRNWLFEIKDPDKFPSQRHLTLAEEEFFENWRGQVSIIHSLDEALAVINAA